MQFASLNNHNFIHQKVIQTCLIPGLFFLIVLGCYVIYTNITTLRNNAQQHSDNLLLQIEKHIEAQPTVESIPDTFNNLSALLLADKYLNSAVLVKDNRIISEVGTRLTQENPLDVYENYGIADETLIGIREITINTEPYYIVLGLDYTPFLIESYRVIFITVLILLIIATLSITAFYYSQHVVHQTLAALQHLVEHHTQNSDNTAISSSTLPMATTLERWILDLKENHALSKSQQQAQQQVIVSLEKALKEHEQNEYETRHQMDEIHRVKSEFLAIISHEMRTPLNVILGFTKLLLKDQPTAKQADLLTTIEKSSDSLLYIINDILDFSKIEAGKLILDREGYDIRDLFDEVLSMLAPLALEKQLELISSIHPDIPHCLLGDPMRIKQIITNLVNNAIKFTQTGSVIITAHVDQSLNDDSTMVLRIAVSDTGIGLSQQQQKSLFEAFTQADTSTTRKFGGTGLGLVIAKRLIEQMSGQIGLESTLGRGSTFWFTIHCDIEPNQPTTTTHQELAGKRLLYFETHPTTRQAVSHLFKNWQINFDITDDLDALVPMLKQAIDRQESFDLIVIALSHTLIIPVDINEILAQLTEFPSKVLVLSNRSEPSYAQELLDAGADACVIKPAFNKKLKQALLRLLSVETYLERPQQISDLKLEYGQGIKILAVDDNPANLKFLCTLLEEMGISYHQANSGQQAIDLFKKHRFDLILMDIQMPEMDGLQATMRIRMIEGEDKHTPIIAVTAHAMESEQAQLLKAGMDGYITKPIDIDQLHHLLDDLTKEIHHKNKEQNHSHFDLPSALLVVDTELGIKLANGKQALASDMFNIFLKNLDQDQNRINKAYADQDLEQLAAYVHRLHGATCYCGVPRLKKVAHHLETLIKTKQLKQLQQAIDTLNDEAIKIRDWVDENPGVYTD